MTESFEQQYYELINQAARLPRSDAQVALVEEAVRLADLHQDAKKSFAARIQLVDAANHSGYPEKALRRPARESQGRGAGGEAVPHQDTEEATAEVEDAGLTESAGRPERSSVRETY